MGKNFEPKNIRNVSISGASDVGKTTLCEAMLFTAGQIKEMGSVERGTTVMDFDEEEINRKMSIRCSLAHLEWEDTRVNLVDTPGIPDLVSNVRSAFRVTEGIIFAIDSLEGITIDTEKDWHFADDYQIARVVFINGMDKDGADFYKVADSLKSKFETRVVPIQLPIGSGADFKGTVDLVHMKAWVPDGKGVKEGTIPEDMTDKIHEYREILFDAVAETDDALIEKVLNEEELTVAEIEQGLKNTIMDGKVIPIMCGSGINNIGTHVLLDTIVSSFPSPLYVGEVEGHAVDDEDKSIMRHPDVSEPFSAFIFKTRIDPFAGKISYARIRSGSIKQGAEVLNVKKDSKEKVTHLFKVNGKKTSDIEQLNAGDIAIFTKMDSFDSGDTITDLANPVVFKTFSMPKPSYFVAIHSSDRKTEDKISTVFNTVIQEDPTFNFAYNDVTKEMVVSCIGEIQARIIFDSIKHKNNLEFETRPPRVTYKETITLSTEAQYKHKKQSGGHGQYGEVYLRVEPTGRNEGFEFVEKIFGGAIPKNYFAAIEKGAIEACEKGVVGGYPVEDVRVTLFDGSYHDVDSSDMAFKIAARHATLLAFEQAKSVILEPIADVKIFVPEEYIGGVMSDMSNRRGKVVGMDKMSSGMTVINASAPYSEMLVYSPVLNGLTSGRGSFEMDTSHYDVLPEYEYKKAIQQAEEMKKEEEEK